VADVLGLLVDSVTAYAPGMAVAATTIVAARRILFDVVMLRCGLVKVLRV
jgi:hypothetical protein